ncbi:VCBS repeat-containing protein [Streptomyces sp. R302]|uniref:FG-GAP repeat domain-containing protein n=1 Tax=unclassified Streptomyces TaxID=2593676 RepID=UPI00145DB4BD|nr:MULTISPECIES: VCBS repeat-containing protein [unclassified Streptomyces]NML50208.1 VCBS repeat-containing protein [Streptomyces sp. R301]NML79199.1 VCBS repeat-containing protein [Streptomyces sp. R302]
MTHPRSTAHRRLGAVVAVVLMATAGPAVLPAGAATGTGALPVAAPAATSDVTAPLFKPGDTVWGLGRTGFLTWDAADPNVKRWTRLSDGAVTTFPYDSDAFGSHDSDVVVLRGYSKTTLRSMETGADLLSVPMRPNQYAGAVGSTLFTSTTDSGEGPLELHSPGTNGPVRRTASGLHLGAAGQHVVAAAGNEALVRYTTGSGADLVRHLAVLDIPSATVVSTHRTGTPGQYTDFALSAGYVAWTEAEGTAATVVVLDRATQKVQRFKVPEAPRLSIGLVGKWITYSRPGGLQEYGNETANALTARSLTSTATRKLLDHTVSGIDAPGDAHGFLGGTVAGGEGLYRIAPGTDGVPVASLVASTGAPTQVALLRHNIPTTLDLDRTGGGFSMAWDLSRNNVDMTVTLRNTRTGESITEYVGVSTRGEDWPPMRFDWDGNLDWHGDPGFRTAASAGPYTWQITATPRNGIGPALKESGSFTVTRKTGAHDYDSDGSPDILARDTAGRLWIQDVHHDPGWTGTAQNPDSLVGGGWQVYDRIEATGNIAGAAAPDVVARDRDGALWLYLSKGDGTFTARRKIGGGWNTYVHLTGGSDLTGDGRPDLVATDRSGRLWLYRSTGSVSAPFATRRLIGSGGWQTYDRLAATGNIAGAAAGDLVARDRDGVLWLYLGKGDGTFAPRTKIGGGWQRYDDLIGSGDVDRDGRPDLYVADVEYGNPSPGFYRGTGAWRTPFRPVERLNTVHIGRTFNLFA